MKCMSLLAYSACAPDPAFRAGLPFAVADINRETMPPMLRRRCSQATQMAFSAAVAACAKAGRSPAELPSIFASVAGEIQTTDLLCNELVKVDGVISPSAFHNSVQNTAAGYWCISQHCTEPASALAAGADTVAMALLEAWCQLACHGGEVLLICYDESWPTCLDPGKGEPAFACALVLAAGAVDGAILQLRKPQRGETVFPAEFAALAEAMPVLAAMPLLRLAATGGEAQSLALSTRQPGWRIEAHQV